MKNKLIEYFFEEREDKEIKNALINYFFDDMEEYEAYKPFLKLLSTLGLINLIVALLCL